MVRREVGAGEEGRQGETRLESKWGGPSWNTVSHNYRQIDSLGSLDEIMPFCTSSRLSCTSTCHTALPMLLVGEAGARGVRTRVSSPTVARSHHSLAQPFNYLRTSHTSPSIFT